MEQDKLIFSGLLYEGSDFALWKAKLDAILIDKRAGQRWGPETRVKIIQTFVSEALLRRVPTAAMLNDKRLLRALGKLATPFSLLDLPVAVRQQIYDLVLPPYYDVGGKAKSRPESEFPALLLISSQVRKEALPLFYSRTSFCIDCYVLLARPSYLKAWVEHVAGENVRQIEQVCLCTSQSDSLIFITYSATDGDGLQVGSLEVLHEDIHAKVEDIEQWRKALKLRGEAIFMALWSDVSLWQEWEDANAVIESSDEDVTEDDENEAKRSAEVEIID